MTLFDTHCHLVSSRLKDEFLQLVEEAQAGGVAHILNVAYNLESATTLKAQLELCPQLMGAMGVQPHDAQSHTPDSRDAILSLIEGCGDQIRAIGEIGLDAFHNLAPQRVQESCFEEWLEISLQKKLPVVVHVRETHDAVYSRLKTHASRGGSGVIHCFTGAKDEAFSFLDLGYRISFSGILTFKNSQALRDTAQALPLDALLIETDSPYLAPIPHRGKSNRPLWVREVNQTLAALHGTTPEEMAQITTDNAVALFGLPKV